MPNIGVVGIVAEYNPYHLGHAWMIDELFRRGAEGIVCVMSGTFVQRGEPAIFPAHVRAKAAIEGGVDIVFRLPLPYSTLSAEGFARAAVSLMVASCCVDTLAFGAETPNTQLMMQAAQLFEQDSHHSKVKKELSKGVSYAVAKTAAIAQTHPDIASMLKQPNNILGVEYCKALFQMRRALIEPQQRAGKPPRVRVPFPLALQRTGAAHDAPSSDLSVGEIVSASAIRQAMKEKGEEALYNTVPEECLDIYEKAMHQGEMIDDTFWNTALLSRLRGMSPEQIAKSPGASEGLEVRIAQAAKQATNLNQLYDLAKSKRYVHSRIRRLALNAGLGVKKDLPPSPPFLHLLGASPEGLHLMGRVGKKLLPISTSLAKLEKENERCAKIVKLEAESADLYALCQEWPKPGGKIFTQAGYFPEDT